MALSPFIPALIMATGTSGSSQLGTIVKRVFLFCFVFLPLAWFSICEH